MQACVLSWPLPLSQPDCWHRTRLKRFLMKHHHIICKWANCAHSISNLQYWQEKKKKMYPLKMHKHYCEWNVLQQVTDRHSQTVKKQTRGVLATLARERKPYVFASGPSAVWQGISSSFPCQWVVMGGSSTLESHFYFAIVFKSRSLKEGLLLSLCRVDRCRRGHTAKVISISWCWPKWVWLTLPVVASQTIQAKIIQRRIQHEDCWITSKTMIRPHHDQNL